VQSKKYYYKVRAVDNAGAVSVYSNTVIKSPEGKYTTPPSAGGVPSVTAGSTTAVVKWTTSRTAFGSVDYGKTSDYGLSSSESNSVAGHSIKISGLTPGETYHYRIQSLDDSELVGYERSTAFSTDYSFTTLAGAEISTITVDEIGLESATISWKTKTMATSKIDYGLTSEYGTSQEVSTTASENDHTVRLAQLTHSTVYHFRIKGTDVDGNDMFSQDQTFETITFPKITAYVVKTDQGSGGTSLAIAWSSNIPISSTVDYQTAKLTNPVDINELAKMSQAELLKLPITTEGERKQTGKADLTATHLVKINDLNDGSIYIINLRGRDQYGNEAVSDPIRYVTGKDTRPPVISNVAIETQQNGSGTNATAIILVSWDTDEPATTQVAYGNGTGTDYASSTAKDDKLELRHVAVIRDLQMNTAYHLKIKTADSSGNMSESQDMISVTPGTQESALDVVLKNLQDVFGFLNI
jgi:hypothetical protein